MPHSFSNSSTKSATAFNWRWIKTIAPLAASTVLLVILSLFSMQVLSAIRAYVGGESLYSKAQKDAALSLSEYAHSQQEADYRHFLRTMQVPLGEHQARLALEQSAPDVAAARTGFLAARNNDNDIDGMIWLFLHFHDINFMRDCITIWTLADGKAAALIEEGRQLHGAILAGHADRAAVGASVARIGLIDQSLTALTDTFSAKLGLVSRFIEKVLMLTTLLAGAMLLLAGSLIARSILKKNTAIERALRSSISSSIDALAQREQVTSALTHSNRALEMLSLCNEAMIRAADENELLQKICQLVVDIGAYRVAGVAYAVPDGAIFPSAQAGPADEEAVRCARAPALQTLAEGRSTVFQTVNGSGICLPLREKRCTFGVLALCSTATSVTEHEMALLQNLADDLAFGISTLRAHAEQRRIQSAVIKIAAGVSMSTGTEFFRQLARNMTEALGADAGFVTQIVAGEALTARTLGAFFEGRIIDNFTYGMRATPCEQLLQQDDFAILEHVSTHFTLVPQLCGLNIQAYVGRCLVNSEGERIGFLFVIFKQALSNAEFAASTLQIFAARAAAEMERQQTDARIHAQAALLDKAQDAIIVQGIDQRISFWNKGAERLYGWTQEEALGRFKQDLLLAVPAIFINATEAVLGQGEWNGEMSKRRKDGSTLAVESRWTLVRDEAGEPLSILTIDTDITARKLAEKEILQLAFYDQLTLLPNRRLLMDSLQQALLSGARNEQTGALLFIDLDNFKTINDTMGHSSGDLLLQKVALRLAACVRASDTVARLGGDEFIVMLLNLGSVAASPAGIVAEKILATLSEPYDIGGARHHSTASIGITLFHDGRGTVDDLLKQADLAMYQAKLAGRNTLRFFDPQMQAAALDRAALEADLRLAMQQNQFLLHYQAQVDADGHVTGVEALLRWQHPHRGQVAPGQFIALAEETGLILPIGLWVLETACLQLVSWADRPETAALTMAVNVSVRQFRQIDFAAQVIALLARFGADPRRLKLELTESLMVHDMAATIEKMSILKAHGVRFALDDFGTGYSSLTYLKRLPLDQLKIDQSFIRDVLTDHNDAAIVRSIVALAQSLGLAVIAEGVENEAQRAFLMQHGCRAYQGYLFAKPVPIGALDLSQRSVNPAASAGLTLAF